MNSCCKRKAQKSEIILEDLIESRKDNKEFLIPNKNNNNNINKTNSNSIKNLENNDNNNFTMNISRTDYESLKHLKDTKTNKKETHNQEKTETNQIPNTNINTNTYNQPQQNKAQSENKNYLQINNKNKAEIQSCLNNSTILKNLNISYSAEKSENKNSQFLNNSICNLNNTTKMDSIYSAVREKETESCFSAEINRDLNPIGKIQNELISPILSKKHLDKQKIRKNCDIDSMRNDLKKWAF